MRADKTPATIGAADHGFSVGDSVDVVNPFGRHEGPKVEGRWRVQSCTSDTITLTNDFSPWARLKWRARVAWWAVTDFFSLSKRKEGHLLGPKVEGRWRVK